MHADKQKTSVFDYQPDDMVTEIEAARIIGMSVQFLRQSRMDGLRVSRTAGPPYHKFVRSVRYKISDLTAWLALHRIEPTATNGDT